MMATDDLRAIIVAECKTYEEPGIEGLFCKPCQTPMHTFSHFAKEGGLVAITLSCPSCATSATFVPHQADSDGGEGEGDGT